VFKQALQSGRPQIGLWLGLADSYVAELLATTGFDWLLIDAEARPNDSRSVLRQLQAVAPYPAACHRETRSRSVELIKQYLDLGVQTVLVPMVETAETGGPHSGGHPLSDPGNSRRGQRVGALFALDQIDGYLLRSDEEMCVLVQVESVAALGNLEAIAAVPGVDGVFFVRPTCPRRWD